MPTKNLESTGTTLDGTLVTLRRIRPEDEPVLQDLFAHMSLEDCACASLRRCAS